MLHKNVDRISAEQDMRAFQLMVHQHSGDSIKSMLTDLQTQMGKVIQVDPVEVAVPRADKELMRKLNLVGDLLNDGYSR